MRLNSELELIFQINILVKLFLSSNSLVIFLDYHLIWIVKIMVSVFYDK